MKKLLCREYPVDNHHNVMLLYHNDSYDCYVMEHDDDRETPYLFMFGTPVKQDYGKITLAEAVDMAIANAPIYYHLFEEEQ